MDDDHREQRLGHVTASRFSEVLPDPRPASKQLADSAESYMWDLLVEHLTGQPANNWTNRAVEWGLEWEPQARTEYVVRTGNDVSQDGFHAGPEWVGASPDGLIGEDGILEIKCPYYSRHHLSALFSGSMPRSHDPQVQGQLWITGRQWAHFVSYDPRLPLEEWSLLVVKVERDEEYIERLAGKVLRFRDLMLDRLRQLKEIGKMPF